MYKKYKLKPPFFEIGPKIFLYGQSSLNLALEADKISEKYDVHIIYTPQYVDISLIAKHVKNISIFAQHIDPVKIGRGIGAVLPEAIKDAGASGTLLNHAEKKMTLSDISNAIKRADEVGLATMVCADNLSEVLAVAQLGPNIILAEPERKIGKKERMDKSNINNRDYIREVKESVKAINPLIKILFSTGIYEGSDVYNIIMMGAEATGCTSGIIRSKNPIEKMDEMISFMRKGWNDFNKKM